jgi:DNA-binding CsgD family transcriptional regulator
MSEVRHTYVVSQRRLTGELLSDLLLLRCGMRVHGNFRSLAECARQLDAAGLVVCDTAGIDASSLEDFSARARSMKPALNFITVDDSATANGIAGEVLGRPGRREVQQHQLTPHEIDVLLAVAAGLRNSDIARRMRRSPKTVEKHRANLQRKLGLRNVAQLTAFAIRNGLLDANTIFSNRVPAVARQGRKPDNA